MDGITGDTNTASRTDDPSNNKSSAVSNEEEEEENGSAAGLSASQFLHRMGEKYGESNYTLFRALYKDLCEEVRNEYATKPPAPFCDPIPDPLSGKAGGAQKTTHASASDDSNDTDEAEGDTEATTVLASSSSSAGAAAAPPTDLYSSSRSSSGSPPAGQRRKITLDTESNRGGSADGDAEGEWGRDCRRLTNLPPPTYGDGTWRVRYDELNNMLVFTRDSVRGLHPQRHSDAKKGRAPASFQKLAKVVAYARVEMKDPPKMNATLTFADWCPIEVLIERNNVILHYSIAANEGGLHMRNVRCYDAASVPWFLDHSREAGGGGNGNGNSGAGSVASSSENPMAFLLSASASACRARQLQFYDGPCLWHLELDVQNELYDVMQDHGIGIDWARWVSDWVFFEETRCYTRWALGMLEELLPSVPASDTCGACNRGGEEDFLLEEEREVLNEPPEDFVEIR